MFSNVCKTVGSFSLVLSHHFRIGSGASLPPKKNVKTDRSICHFFPRTKDRQFWARKLRGEIRVLVGVFFPEGKRESCAILLFQSVEELKCCSNSWNMFQVISRQGRGATQELKKNRNNKERESPPFLLNIEATHLSLSRKKRKEKKKNSGPAAATVGKKVF